MESDNTIIQIDQGNSTTKLSVTNNLNPCSTWEDPETWIHRLNSLDKDLDRISVDTSKDNISNLLKNRNNDEEFMQKLPSTVDQMWVENSSDNIVLDGIDVNPSKIWLNEGQSTIFTLEIPTKAEGDAAETDPNMENLDKTEENKNKQDILVEEEEEEEEKFENTVEAKDFHYFKRQCKFENFVTQLGSNSHRSKTQSALLSFFGNSLQEPYIDSDEEDKNESNKPMIGFDTRFTYTREGLMVYDINSNIEIDEPEESTKGITVQDYNVFRNTTPANEYDKNIKYDYYQKFKSYRNALAPFAGLEFATDHERKIYEFLPPFK